VTNVTNKEDININYNSSCFSQSVIHTATFVCSLCQVAVCLKLQTCLPETQRNAIRRHPTGIGGTPDSPIIASVNLPIY